MANLVLTYSCNQNCSFCFVGKRPLESAYTLEKLKLQWPFLESFGEKSIQIVGGEPALNPELPEIIEFLTEKEFNIHVFTNGSLDPLTVERIKNIDSDQLFFIVNRSEDRYFPELFSLYKALGHMVQLSVTIFKGNQELYHIVDEIDRFGLNKIFRIGLALPTLNGLAGQGLAPEKYTSIAAELLDFIKQCCLLGIRPSFDCGFPFCFFDENQKGYLADQGITFKSLCGIIPDITAENEAFPCFPLDTFRFSFVKDEQWIDLKKKMSNFLKNQKRNPVFENCQRCPHILNGNCSGGCLVYQLSKAP